MICLAAAVLALAPGDVEALRACGRVLHHDRLAPRPPLNHERIPQACARHSHMWVMAATEDESGKRFESALQERKNVLTAALAFLAGWGDVVCFRRYGCYAIMMTGNTLAAASAAAMLRWADFTFYVSLLLSYVAGAALIRLVNVKSEASSTASTVLPMAIFCFFSIAEVLGFCFGSSRWRALPLAVGSGLVNAISAEETGTITPWMTGHLQKLGLRLGNFVKGTPKTESSEISFTVVLSFLAGGLAASAALAMRASRLSVDSFCWLGAAYCAILLRHQQPILARAPAP